MLSSKAKYALRAALHLAERADRGGWTQTADIAEAERIPRKFLEAILVQLRDNGLLESRRGPSGGHRLRMAAEQISVAHIIRIVDGPLALTPCASRTRFGPCADCIDIESCRLRRLMQQARDAVAGVLDGCALSDLARMEIDALAGEAKAAGRRKQKIPA
jgi:Rrf2 family protein